MMLPLLHGSEGIVPGRADVIWLVREHFRSDYTCVYSSVSILVKSMTGCFSLVSTEPTLLHTNLVYSRYMWFSPQRPMSQNKAWQKGHGPHCSKQSLTVGIDVACIGCLESDFKVVE